MLTNLEIKMNSDYSIPAMGSVRAQDIIAYMLKDDCVITAPSARGKTYRELSLKDLLIKDRPIHHSYLDRETMTYYFILKEVQ